MLNRGTFTKFRGTKAWTQLSHGLNNGLQEMTQKGIYIYCTGVFFSAVGAQSLLN